MNKRPVFHIENEIIIALAVKRILNGVIPDINVKHYFNGKQAADYLETNVLDNDWPQLILLDITMPVMDGWGFLHFWATLPADLTRETWIYMLSSSNEKDDVDRAMATGLVKEFITKPLRKLHIDKIISARVF